MTDEELIAILRISDEPMHQYAADRIEQLKAEIAALQAADAPNPAPQTPQ